VGKGHRRRDTRESRYAAPCSSLSDIHDNAVIPPGSSDGYQPERRKANSRHSPFSENPGCALFVLMV
jgi:hypothetical protein